MTGLFRKCFAFVGVVVLGVAVGAAASVANASSYLRLDGVTVNPIQSYYGGNHSYAGPNLEPGVVAPGAQLGSANLILASLDHANLSGAWLDGADLSSADLSFANLSGASMWACCGQAPNLTGANFRNADLSYISGKGGAYLGGGADFTNANITNATIGQGANSNFTNANFTDSTLGYDFTNAILVAADLSTAMIDASANFTGATYSTGSLSNRTLFPAGFDPVARGMVLVPEPGTVLLVGIGITGLAARQRHHRRGTRTTRRK